MNRRLSGNLEKVENGTLSGWIWDEANPDQAVEIQIFCDDKPIRTIPANLLRGDLKKAGKGNGRHGYQFALPGKYLDGAEHRLVVKDTLEDAVVGRLTTVLMPRAQNEAGQALAMDIIDDCPALMGDGFSGQVDAQLKDFVLSISGWVRDNNRPGVPVRLALEVRGAEVCRFLAREPIAPNTQGAYGFSLSHVLRERDLGQTVVLRVADTENHIVLDIRKATEAVVSLKEDVLPEIAPDDVIIGNVESCTHSIVSGWALCREKLDAYVELILYADGQPFSVTKTTIYRKDVAAAHGGLGFYGFSFELPPNAAVAESVNYSVRPALGQGELKNSERRLDPLGTHVHPAKARLDRRWKTRPSLKIGERVSVIVLNRNGAGLLAEMFSSAAAVEDIGRVEWLIVDHQSADKSEEICEQAVADGHIVRFLKRDGNFSFSDSNNYGARLASEEVLIFANNDLIYTAPFVDDTLRQMSDPAIGLLGVKLQDFVTGSETGDAPVQHLGVYMNPAIVGGWLRPYEARAVAETEMYGDLVTETPMVTGAFFAMRRTDFEAIGGFEEKYFYGLEDVDLCLNVQKKLGKAVVCLNTTGIIHHRGFSRLKDARALSRRQNNNLTFTKRWSAYLRNTIRKDVLRRPGFWTGRRPVVAFIVTEAGDNISTGDYYTAYEFGQALQKIIPVHVRYLPMEEWYDLSDIDVLIVMVNQFDLMKAKKVSPYIVTINWARQWFDRWAEDRTIHAYDHIWASSQIAADYLKARTGCYVDVLTIASNATRFQSGVADTALASDYCFSGSRFGISRDIEFQLDPAKINGEGAIFGHNWEDTPFENISRGAIAYSRMPDVYASTQIVIDDANIATKPWGSCNSRLFDALAAGCLVMTNGVAGAQELFGDLVPTFHDERSLTEALNYWLEHADERRERIVKLQNLVEEKHTYDNRAATALTLLSQRPARLRIAIKCAAKTSEEQKWGDFHFANSLAAAMRAEGHIVRVDNREDWNAGICDADDVVIVLRGLIAYEPKPHQRNIMWLISHPNDVPISELETYDHVYVASSFHADLLKPLCMVPVEFLPQAVDAQRFRFDPEVVGSRQDRTLFVGNSRNIFREVVEWSMQEKLDIDIYGSGWDSFVPKDRLKGQLVPNEVLGEMYASSRAVLCDHWHDMKAMGYISNRVFDVLMAGGQLIIDDVVGLKELIPGGYRIYNSREELAAAVRTNAPVDIEARRALSQWTAKNHSFNARARTMLERISDMLESKTPPITKGRAETKPKRAAKT